MRVRLGGRLTGRRLTVPDAHAAMWRGWRPNWRSDIIRRYATGGVFLDVGANRGQTLADHLGVRSPARYIGVEPAADSAAAVQQAITDNRLDGLVVCMALADQPAVRPLYSAAGTACDDKATIAGWGAQWGGQTVRHVPALPGDLLWDSLGRPDVSLVKIDVEGTEYLVLAGLQRMLAALRPPLICEVLHAGAGGDLDRYRWAVDRLSGLLDCYGYRLRWRIDRRHGRLTGLTEVDGFPLVRWHPGSHDECDYLLTAG
jgi:FkbM family methyltransferase